MTQRLQLGVFLMVYCALLALLPARSYWLDEVLHLIGARDRTYAEIPVYAAQNAGGVPLGYAYTRASLQVFGDSQFGARLPSILFSAGACAAVFVLAARSGVAYPMAAVLLFAVLPLQFRYALEVRPYSAMLCICAWTLIALLRVAAKPGFTRTLVFFVLVLVGLYTQPYSLLIPLAGVAWLLWRRDRAALWVGGAIVAGVVLFVPWLRFATAEWQREIATYAAKGGFGWREVQLIVKEMTGLGYLGTVAMLVPAIAGLKRMDRDSRVLWSLLLAIPIAGAIAGNLLFGYFFAARQFISVLIPLTVLAVVGIEEYARRWKPLATIWLLIVVGASVLADVQAFRRPREDWGAMTAALRRGATEQRGCVLLAPARSLYLYRFYDAEFAKLLCDPAGDPQKSILLALSPYESAAEYRAALDRLQPKGWKAVREESFQGPKIIWLSKEK